jgi:2,4-dienoyl-CoA reductase-like NADH-dependent reductase (Old Yellow Enzyme family)
MKQLKNIETEAQLAELFAELGVDLPIAREPGPSGLSAPVRIGPSDRSALVAPNRFAMLPMEGWDAEHDGRPTELVERRWGRFGSSGAGLLWGEATAVMPDGRANPNQLMIDRDTVGGFAHLRDLAAPGQVVGLQLTHSGRWARPVGAPAPRTAYAHPVLDDRVGAGPANVFSDGELEDLALAYVEAARLAMEAGFDFVDVKACHGYLLHELLTAHDRPGPYGGDLDGRSRLLVGVLDAIRSEMPSLTLAVRLSIFDLVPHEPGPDGTGVPVQAGTYRYAFGTEPSDLTVDLSETHALLDKVTAAGVTIVGTTAGSPYYCPHAQRPAFFPPSDGYRPPEDPLVSVARQVHATAEVTRRHPDLTVIGAGYSYLQEWLGPVAEAVVQRGWATMIGLGRMALSYPDLPATLLAGRALERRQICRTFSDCTTAPRNGLVSGCYPLDPFYKQREERSTLTRVKREAKARLRGDPED